MGIAELRAAISEHERARYGLDYHPDTQVLVTVGATEAIAGAVLGLVEPGREVIMIEPYYDSYAATVALAGAVRRPVPLVPDGPGFRLDLDALRAAFGPNTAAILLNTPHNPTGTVLTREELAEVARLAVEHDVVVITDEVYEHLVFDDVDYVSPATLDGMAERTLRISGAAKTFNVTGWKVGWICGPPQLVAATRAAKQYLTFVGSGPLQPAVALALRTEMDWVPASAADLGRKRLLLTEGLTSAGFDVHHSSAGYFVVADPRPLGIGDGTELCRTMPGEVGVAAVPVSAFVDDHDRWDHLVRFSFAKDDDVLTEATRRLRSLVPGS